MMSESLDRRLLLRESVQLRMHLLVCIWCVRYLRQIGFLRTLLRDRSADTSPVPALTAEARERIAKSLPR